MPAKVLAVLGVALLALTAFLLAADLDPSDLDGTDGATPEAAGQGSHAVLRGRSGSAGPAEPLPWIEALEHEAATGNEEERHAAIRDLQKRFETGDLPLGALVPWALTPADPDGHDDLARWARSILAKHGPASLAFLPDILHAGLGASETQQDAVTSTLRALETVRPEDVDLVVRLFEHEQTVYWLKRTLVDALEDLGTDALPLAPHLVDFIIQVLRDRAEAERESFLEGIHTTHDIVEYDVQRLLASMGTDVVPLLTQRLVAYPERLRDREPSSDWLLAGHYERAPLGLLAGALAEAGLDGQRALAALLAHEDPRLRKEAAGALGDGPLDPDLFVGPLEAALDDPDPEVRRRAAAALEHCGSPAVPVLLAALEEDPSPEVRKRLAHVLSRLGVDARQGLPPLLEVLADENAFDALEAARSIAKYGKEALPTLARLLPHLSVDDVWFRARFAAPIAIVALHEPESLTRPWDEGDAALRLGLLRVIEQAEEPPPAWRKLLDLALEDPDPAVRVQAAAQWAAAGRTDVSGPLLEGFRSEDGRLRAIATDALPHLGAAMAHVLPDLLERLEHEEGLWRSSEPGNVEKSEESAVDAAVRAFGPYDLPRMFELLDHDEFNLSYAAAGAFREAGLDAIAYFEGAWASASPTRRQKMLGVLRDLLRRKDAAAVLPAVRQLAARGLDDPNPRVRLQATKTLQGDSLHRDLCLDVLAALLEARDIHTVRSAAYRISALEPPAARVEAVLRTHAEHPDAETRGYVRTALERIEDAR